MDKALLETLYETSVSFKIYVDRNCKSYGWTKDRAFKDRIVQSYAEYVIKDQPENAKERKYESKTNCGCC